MADRILFLETPDIPNTPVGEEQGSGGGAVESVNGKTGAVVLNASDVGALPSDTPIPAAVTEQTVAGWGFTKNTGTYSKPSGGIPKTDLASAVQTSLGKADTALQQHQDISGKANTADLAAVATSGSYNDLSDKPTIPTVPTAEISANTAARHTHENKAVLDGITAAKVQSWDGKGTYSKPSGGIPKSDLADGVIPDVSDKVDKITNYGLAKIKSNEGNYTITVKEGLNSSTNAAVVSTGTFATAMQQAGQTLAAKANTADVYTKTEIDNKGYQTAQNVQTAIAGKANSSDIPSASSTAPAMDGTASAGSSAAYARGDHVHPTDTSRLSTSGNAYRAASIPMGQVDSTSTATAFTATVDGITELRDGVCMWLRNGVVTSASGFTLNVNGLGAKPCYSSLAAASRSTTIFNANYTMLLIYNSTRVDGGCWDIVYGVDTNTTYTPTKLGFGYGTCTTAAATAAKTASISSYALTAGGIVSIKFDNDVPANATLNISSKGAKAIYHRGAAITAGVIKAGDTATFVYSTYYHLIAIDRDESGDVLPSVTASDNGKFLRVVNGAWAAQTVPSAESNSFGGGS